MTIQIRHTMKKEVRKITKRIKTMGWLQRILTLFFLLNIAANGFAEETIHLTNGEFTPYMSKELKYYGVVSRVVTEAFAFENIKVEYKFLPWKRAFESAKSGKYEGSVVWSYSAEREEDFYYSDSVIEGNTVFFHLKNYVFNWNTIEDLKGIKIGGTTGYSYGDTFDQAEKAGNLEVHRVTHDYQNFLMLLRGRAQIVPLELEVGYRLLQKHLSPEEVERITHHPKPLKTIPYHLILSKQVERNGHFIHIFNKGLKRLKENGQYEQYIAESRRGEYKTK